MTDQYIIRCNSFDDAARKAAEMNLNIREWSWCPAYTVSRSIQIFERIDNV